MNVFRIIYLALLIAIFSGFLWLGYQTPAYHTDSLYVLLLVIIMVIGPIGAAVFQPWWLTAILLAAIWPLFYLLLSIKHGFLLTGFLSHSKYAALLLFVLLLSGVFLKAIITFFSLKFSKLN